MTSPDHHFHLPESLLASLSVEDRASLLTALRNSGTQARLERAGLVQVVPASAPAMGAAFMFGL